MNLLLSYPRSGNHLVRFLIELLTERPTSGSPGNGKDIPIYKNMFSQPVPFNIKPGTPFYYTKSHKPRPANTLIVIVRDPR